MNLSLTQAPSFDRARLMSRGVSWLSAFMMGAIIFGVIAGMIGLLFFFDLLRDTALTKALVAIKSHNIPQAEEAMTVIMALDFGQRAVIAACFAVAIAPTLFVLFQLRALFAHFAGGQIFTDANIKGLRMVGLGLVASVVTTMLAKAVFVHIVPNADSGVSLTPLSYGAITYVAAYVMGEGRRISDDNAGIV